LLNARVFLLAFFSDADGSGSIDAAELMGALRDLGENPSKGEVAALIAEADSDKSGAIEFDEFLKMVASMMASKGGGGALGAAVVCIENIAA
jgi:Ca2+-binding EF-hand superfamily protein